VAEIKVICPNCGIIKRIEMACMWLGRPPIPEIDNAFCPICGAKTIIERGIETSSAGWTSYKKEFGLE